jgi:hypothetical protein
MPSLVFLSAVHDRACLLADQSVCFGLQRLPVFDRRSGLDAVFLFLLAELRRHRIRPLYRSLSGFNLPNPEAFDKVIGFRELGLK